jgi:hypothetical protein
MPRVVVVRFVAPIALDTKLRFSFVPLISCLRRRGIVVQRDGGTYVPKGVGRVKGSFTRPIYRAV